MGWTEWIEVIVRMKKVGVALSGGGGGDQGGCERRIEVIVKMKICSSFFISYHRFQHHGNISVQK